MAETRPKRKKFNPVGFLFGNVDKNGDLEAESPDKESKKGLNSMIRRGYSRVRSALSDVIDFAACGLKGNPGDVDPDDWYRETATSGDESEQKVDSAVNFSDISELATDEEASEVPTQPTFHELFGTSSSSESSDEPEQPMPRPPPLKKQRLEAPLEHMRPKKYANVDVRQMYPDFAPDKVLRMQRLLGPGKKSDLPQIWRGVQRRQEAARVSKREKAKSKTGFKMNFAPIPEQELWASDDEDKLLSPSIGVSEKENRPPEGDAKVPDWRFGPAQYWYDKIGLPAAADGFDYGFKLKEEKEEAAVEEEVPVEPFPDDAFLMISQKTWEDDVIWDATEFRRSLPQKNWKEMFTEWNRVAEEMPRFATFLAATVKKSPVVVQKPKQSIGDLNKGTFKEPLPVSSKGAIPKQRKPKDQTWYSIFPVENQDLVYGRWEDEVIWDAEAMSEIPQPKMLTLDPNDENIILGIPDDPNPAEIHRKKNLPVVKPKFTRPHLSKSKILLSKAGVINVFVDDTPPPRPKTPDRDPWDISNDQYYHSMTTDVKLSGSFGLRITHSTPAVQLQPPIIPSYRTANELRHFHRPSLVRYTFGNVASWTVPQPVISLTKHILRQERARARALAASGGGDMFFMHTLEDLSAKDGELILVEFSEEHPPLISEVGMCSQIRTYFKRTANKDSRPPELRYGEVAVTHSTPFLGALRPGEWLQSIENKMYRAPLYEHRVSPTDFLVIRSRDDYFIREINGLFVVGQECPMMEVMTPTSRQKDKFSKDFMQVMIYRFIQLSPKYHRIVIDDIKAIFPDAKECTIRKALKQTGLKFERNGIHAGYWVLQPGFRLPTEEEIRAMVSPEQCCIYFSMLAAKQRLRDAGYGQNSIAAALHEDLDGAPKQEDEVLAAPWNTTAAFVQAQRGKCILDLDGPADPTGCAEGFSYVRRANKPCLTKEEREKRTLIGTDSDLRRLSVTKGKSMLRKHGLADKEIKKLSRWEVIDAVRTLSNEMVKAGEESALDKYARTNAGSIIEHQERYRKDCQDLFELQNQVLASGATIPSDDEEETSSSSESESESEDNEALGKKLENALMDDEERQRKDLIKWMREGSKLKEPEVEEAPRLVPKVLRITRTRLTSDGREVTEIETVTDPRVIELYVRVKQTKDQAFINRFVTESRDQKERHQREKRRVVSQLKTTTKLLEKTKKDAQLETEAKHKKGKLNPNVTIKCGACGQKGHMKTNKMCPLYEGKDAEVAVKEEPEEMPPAVELPPEPSDLSIKVEGVNIKLSGLSLQRHLEEKKRPMEAKVTKLPEPLTRKRRRPAVADQCDYLKPKTKPVKRRRSNYPIDQLNEELMQILNALMQNKTIVPELTPFLRPVRAKDAPDYFKIIKRPMDLSTIRKNLDANHYTDRKSFLIDFWQMIENSRMYNGPKHTLTLVAEQLMKLCGEAVDKKEARLIELEKKINPMLSDNPREVLAHVLGGIVNRLREIRTGWSFLKPVDKSRVKDYYSVVMRPMDLETIGKKTAAFKYPSSAEFVADLELIVANCELYNGKESILTNNAKSFLKDAKKVINEAAIHYAEILGGLLKPIEEKKKIPIIDPKPSTSAQMAPPMIQPPEMQLPKIQPPKSFLAEDLELSDTSSEEDELSAFTF